MKTITIDGVQIPTDKLIAAGWKAPEEKKSIVWKPEIGESYYYLINGYCLFMCKWDGNGGDELMYAVGNCYRTKEDAQRAADVTKATVRVNRRIEELNGGWVADWKNDNQKKWFLEYDYGTEFLTSLNRVFGMRARGTCQFPNKLMWIASKTIAETIIGEMHDDLCTIFGVERGEQI